MRGRGARNAEPGTPWPQVGRANLPISSHGVGVFSLVIAAASGATIRPIAGAIVPFHPEGSVDRQANSIVSWTHFIYALHAFSLLTGILGAATVIGAFLTGWPSIIAVILNYVKRSEARGTWVDSHFRWQIRTFWFGLLWISLCLAFIVLTLGIGIIIAWVPMVIVSLWFVYRIVRGWMALGAGRPMYGERVAL